MTTTDCTITTYDFDALDAGLAKGFENAREAGMKEVSEGASARGLVRNVLESGRGNICEEDLATTRRLAGDIFREVSGREIDWVGCLVAKDR